MREKLERKYFRAILDAIPSPVFVVDDDVRILDFNEAAVPLLGENPTVALKIKGGEALHCLNSASSEGGCGRSPNCGDCVIRNSVSLTYSGRKISRRATRMELVRGPSIQEVYLLVTTSPFLFEDKAYALLILEDISELMDLRKVIPICASCKKIRDDEEFWDHVENYLKKHLDMDFTHGICPDCVQKLYPDLYSKLRPESGRIRNDVSRDKPESR